jgi:hypothetical protein
MKKNMLVVLFVFVSLLAFAENWDWDAGVCLSRVNGLSFDNNSTRFSYHKIERDPGVQFSATFLSKNDVGLRVSFLRFGVQESYFSRETLFGEKISGEVETKIYHNFSSHIIMGSISLGSLKIFGFCPGISVRNKIQFSFSQFLQIAYKHTFLEAGWQGAGSLFEKAKFPNEDPGYNATTEITDDFNLFLGIGYRL